MRRSVLILGALAGVTAVIGVVLTREDTAEPEPAAAAPGADLEVFLEPEAPAGEEIDEQGLQDAMAIMRGRLERLDTVTAFEVSRGDANLIVLRIATTDASETERAVELVTTAGRLEFYKLQGNVAGPSRGPTENPVVPRTAAELRELLDRAPDELPAGEVAPSAWYVLDGSQLVAGPASTRAGVLAQAGDATGELYVVPAGRTILTCGEDARACPGVGAAPSQTFYYLFEHRPDDADDPVPQITGADLRPGTQVDLDRGQPIVVLEFTEAGGEAFERVTRELAERGGEVCATLDCGAGSETGRAPALQSFVIAVDDEILTFPTIDFVGDTAQGITGRRAQISGFETNEEADALALMLLSGALPYAFREMDRKETASVSGAPAPGRDLSSLGSDPTAPALAALLAVAARRRSGPARLEEAEAERQRVMRAIMEVVPRRPAPTTVAREEPAGR